MKQATLYLNGARVGVTDVEYSLCDDETAPESSTLLRDVFPTGECRVETTVTLTAEQSEAVMEYFLPAALWRARAKRRRKAALLEAAVARGGIKRAGRG